jgi:aspartate-semialdehyde dehydrogenase
MKAQTKLRLAIVGTDSMRGKEIKGILSERKFPVEKIEFFDPQVEEAYSKLTEFQGEPRVILPLELERLGQADLVFLASDRKTNRKIGALAVKKKFRAIDLSETFAKDPKIPVVVAGINDKKVLETKPHLLANPHPVAVILSHLFQAVLLSFGLKRALSFVLQPASAFDEPGMEELANQSVDIMNGASLKKKVFRAQTAFNFLPQVERSDDSGHTSVERQIVDEVGRILGRKKMSFSLSIIQAPVFHSYSIMSYIEMGKRAEKHQIEDLFKKTSPFKYFPSSLNCPASCVSVAGQEDIYVSQIKKDKVHPNGFWIWTVADNLTFGSALNAWKIASQFIPSGHGST